MTETTTDIADGTDDSTDYDVAEDSELLPEEKETILRLSKSEGRVNVFSEEASIMKRLLEHPEGDVEPDRVVDGTVMAVKGTIPVGTLSISRDGRQTEGHAEIVSNSVIR
jgi:hypothetical protein